MQSLTWGARDLTTTKWHGVRHQSPGCEDTSAEMLQCAEKNWCERRVGTQPHWRKKAISCSKSSLNAPIIGFKAIYCGTTLER